MSRILRIALQTRWAGYAIALAAVALISILIGLVLAYLQVSGLLMLYLVAVLAVAIFFGRGPAIAASLVALLAYDWFFVPPQHTFTIASAEEWIALLLFLITAVATGQVAASQRQRAQEAEQREREAVVLYDVVRLMSEPDLRHALQDVAQRLSDELHLAGVIIEVNDESGVTGKASVADDDARRLFEQAPAAGLETLGIGPPATGARRSVPGRWIRIVPPTRPVTRPRSASDRLFTVPVRVRDRKAGDLFLVRHAGVPKFAPADDRLLSAVAAQLGLAVERVALQREATEAEVLRRADKLKTALLNAVSHDLRTPLTSIITSAGSLLQEDVTWTGDERRDLATAIEEEALRLNQIVGNLLDLSRMEGGSLRPEKGWYDIESLVDDVLGRLRPLTDKHQVVVDVPDDLPPVWLDYVEIDQVLSNLVENAAKYAPPGTEIRLSVLRTGNELRVEVADRGPGVPPAALQRLFEPFYRVSGQGPRPKGTGLGLAVAKGLVEAHGGRIWAENRREGGTRFVFTLPLEGPAEPPHAPRETQE